jgi:hypothetical protein
MGLNKVYLREKKILEKEYADLGHNEFVRVYGKYEIVIGSPSAINFINKKIKEKPIKQKNK